MIKWSDNLWAAIKRSLRSLNSVSNTIILFVRKVVYKINPDHCACCGVHMHVKRYEIAHTFGNNKRLAVSNCSPYTVCRACMLEKLSTEAWEPRFTNMHRNSDPTWTSFDSGWKTSKCSITGASVDSYRDVEIHPYISLLLCTTSWNRDNVCKQAVLDCIEKGKIRTDMFGVVNNKVESLNHKRLPIGPDGKLI